MDDPLAMVTSPGNHIPNGACQLPSAGQTAFELGWKPRQKPVFRNANRIGLRLERILDFHVILFCTEDNSDRGLVSRAAFPVVEQI